MMRTSFSQHIKCLGTCNCCANTPQRCHVRGKWVSWDTLINQYPHFLYPFLKSRITVKYYNRFASRMATTNADTIENPIES